MKRDDGASALLRRGLFLEFVTLGWNVVGTGVVLVAAWSARSVALAGFGLDSLIEIGASSVVVWELKGTGHGREKRGLMLIGWAFLALAIYVLGQSSFSLVSRSHPSPSPVGLTWLIATLIAMLMLARAKGKVGRLLNNVVLLTESRVTMVDALLAGSTLVGVALNTWAGWWWADPLSGLVIVVYGVKEGLHALRESQA